MVVNQQKIITKCSHLTAPDGIAETEAKIENNDGIINNEINN